MIGSGTLAASPSSVWTPEQGYPPAAAAFAELRQRLGRPPEPEVAVISGERAHRPRPPGVRGRGDRAHDRRRRRAARRTAARRRDRRARARPSIRRRAVAALHERGHRLILSEGGPHAIAPFLEAGLVDELFLTISPLLAGRLDGDDRLALVEGADLIPGGPLAARLLGVRRDGGHLFLRYELDTTRGKPPRRPRPGA